jgi:G6PDH family F420-dependent oxidoreductase
MRIGYYLSSEECGPAELVRQARLAEQAGFDGLWISDHFHPWNDEQGHSPFVWTVVGAIAEATSRMRLTTAVTCPIMRIHPAIVAQAAATSAAMLGDRFALGVGTGEALNEHILGHRWPAAEVRREMLAEALQVIRTLWKGGVQSHRARYYRVEKARIYDLPERPPPIVISGFGPHAIKLAALIGDGFCTVSPAKDAVELFRREGGEGKLVAGGMKVCWDEREDRARATAHRVWPSEVLPGELAQVLPTPAHFEQACQLVTEDMVAEAIPCGPDLERHVERLQLYVDAGFEEVYVQQVGGGYDRFFELYASDVLPRFRESGAVSDSVADGRSSRARRPVRG